MRSIEEIKEAISTGKACLGIEFGSTRIKAVLIDVDKAPLLPEPMTGKTDMKIISGHTVRRISGTACRDATRIW